MEQKKISRQYGLWSSPISPISLARGINFSDVLWAQDGTLVWREARSDRGVLVAQPADGQAPRDLTSEFSIRGRVGYGGGDFGLGRNKVILAEAASGRLFCQPLGTGSPRPITPAFGCAAAPCPSPDGSWLLFVHTYEGQDVIAIVDIEGRQWPARLVSGADFYMQPCWHPSGEWFAYVSWDHPNMPWEGTRLTLAHLVSAGRKLPEIVETMPVAGSENIPVFQPEFSPDGRYLAYVSEQTGWWQLYLYDLESKTHTQLTDEAAEHGAAAWVQGVRTYAFSPDGQYIWFIRNQMSTKSLWRLEIISGALEQIHVGSDYTSLDQIAMSPDGNQVALIASGSATPMQIITCSLSGKTRIIRRSISEELPAEIYVLPEHLSWKGMDGQDAHGLLYLPKSTVFENSGKPPLIMNIHGGPTGQRINAFNLAIQYFTSRGYAYLDVNYRGSTGYGREYRNMLHGNWGIYDVQDAIAGVHSLDEQGLIDSKRVIIMGGSAGGFTVLKALEDYPGYFKAGICLYGVSNQFTLAAETHKFEAHYTDTLIGPLPEAAELYRSRSPAFFVDKIQDPIAIFQGEEDVVVPRSQSDEVVESLRRRGIPHIYHLYPGEGHGFRKAETIEHFYQMIDKFLKQYVIYA